MFFADLRRGGRHAHAGVCRPARSGHVPAQHPDGTHHHEAAAVGGVRAGVPATWLQVPDPTTPPSLRRVSQIYI